MKESGTEVVAERRFVDTWRYFRDLGPYLGRRSAKLWGGTIKRKANPQPPPEVVPDIVVDRRYEFEQGGRRFEVISTPGGEALDSIVVWMPQGARCLHGQSIRAGVPRHAESGDHAGDKPRLVQRYLAVSR